MSGRIGHAVDVASGLRWLDAVLGSSGGFHEIRVVHGDGSRGTIWPPAGDDRYWLAHYVELLEEISCVDVELAIPKKQRVTGLFTPFPVLWVRVETAPAAERLRRFKPRPTFVFREGVSSRYTALWALTRPLVGYAEVLQANERLSFALSGRRRAANPDNFAFAPPGVVLRPEGKRPVPVLFGRATMDAFDVNDVVGRLKDAPDPDAWRS